MSNNGNGQIHILDVQKSEKDILWGLSVHICEQDFNPLHPLRIPFQSRILQFEVALFMWNRGDT